MKFPSTATPAWAFHDEDGARQREVECKPYLRPPKTLSLAATINARRRHDERHEAKERWGHDRGYDPSEPRSRWAQRQCLTECVGKLRPASCYSQGKNRHCGPAPSVMDVGSKVSGDGEDVGVGRVEARGTAANARRGEARGTTASARKPYAALSFQQCSLPCQ